MKSDWSRNYFVFVEKMAKINLASIKIYFILNIHVAGMSSGTCSWKDIPHFKVEGMYSSDVVSVGWSANRLRSAIPLSHATLI